MSNQNKERAIINALGAFLKIKKLAWEMEKEELTGTEYGSATSIMDNAASSAYNELVLTIQRCLGTQPKQIESNTGADTTDYAQSEVAPGDQLSNIKTETQIPASVLDSIPVPVQDTAKAFDVSDAEMEQIIVELESEDQKTNVESYEVVCDQRPITAVYTVTKTKTILYNGVASEIKEGTLLIQYADDPGIVYGADVHASGSNIRDVRVSNVDPEGILKAKFGEDLKQWDLIGSLIPELTLDSVYTAIAPMNSLSQKIPAGSTIIKCVTGNYYVAEIKANAGPFNVARVEVLSYEPKPIKLQSLSKLQRWQ